MKQKLIALTCLIAISVSAQAVTIYNNFGPGNSFNVSTGWVVGFSAGNVWEISMTFTAAATASVTSITVATNSPYASGVSAQIYTISGGVPATLLEADLSATNVGGMFSINGSGTTLTASTSYMLTLRAVNPTEGAGWCFTSPQVNSAGAFRFNNGSWSPNNFEPASVFRIEGNPVPEPASLLALSLGAFWLRRRKAN